MSTSFTSEVIALSITFIILYGTIFETKQKSKKRTAFIFVVSANAVSIFSQILTRTEWIMQTSQFIQTTVYMLTFMSTLIVTALFIRYVYLHLSESVKIRKLLFTIPEYVLYASALFTMISSYMGKIFILSGNDYILGDWHPVYMVLNILPLLFMTAVILLYSRSIGLHDSIAVFSYFSLPFIYVIINTVIPSFSFLFITMALDELVIYIMLQSDNAQTLEKLRQAEYDKAHKDQLTGMMNRLAYNELCDSLSGNSEVAVIFCDVNGLKYANDNLGHGEGDKLLCNYADMLKKVFDEKEAFRISGDEFVVISVGENSADFDSAFLKLKSLIGTYDYPIASVGVSKGTAGSINDLIREAEENMYSDKKEFYKQYPQYIRK